MSVFRRLAAALILCCAGIVSAAEPLFPGLAEPETLSAKFRQEKTVSGFRNRLVITGRLSLEKSGNLAWRVETPLRYRCIIADGFLSQWDSESGSVTKLKLSEHPAVSAMIRMMKIFLAPGGSAEAGKYFTAVRREGREFDFAPRPGTPAGEAVKLVRILISADGNYVEKTTLFETNGDVTEIAFSDVRLNEKLSPETWDAGKP